jgi:hypothetical protein
LLLLVLALMPTQLAAQAQSTPQVQVRSHFTMNRYGYAIVNETVSFTNNGTSVVSAPPLTIGFGNLSSKIVDYRTTSGFAVSTLNGTWGPFVFGGGETVQAGNTTSFALSLLVDGVVSTATNGSLEVMTLSRPSLSIQVNTIEEVVTMPNSTQLASYPTGLGFASNGVNFTYFATFKEVAPQPAVTSLRAITQSPTQDFHPLEVYSASRVISAGTGGNPMVTDTISFKNLGTTDLSALHVASLTSPDAFVTILPPAEPKLLNPVRIAMSSYSISLANPAIGSPVSAGSNYTIVYQYNLDNRYYTVNGGQVDVNIPATPPIVAFVDSYSIGVSVPAGVRVVVGPPGAFSSLTPWQGGTTSVAYALSVGWAIDAGIPAASIVFVLLFAVLFVSRTTATEEEETEEESSTERAAAMIKAFDEKTSLINGLWAEVSSKDANEIDKEFFDGLRVRMDSFRSRALQRLNEMKQKSTTQKFFDLLNQIHMTEREVDRAAKDKLNLYEQYYMKRMRKEVFDRLLPQYTKRLERALNQLSDELHVVQREAKML